MKCKNCGKESHYCCSCDSELHKDYGYCSEKCWKDSDEYKENYKIITSFYNALTKSFQESLIHLFDMDLDLVEIILREISKKD